MKKNILISSAGAKVLLVRAFRDAAQQYGARVFTGDAREKCAAGMAADSHIHFLPLSDPAFEHQLFDLIAEQDIGLIVPTRDGELKPLASMSEKFAAAGTAILCCDQLALASVQDKNLYSDKVEALGFRALPRVLPQTDGLAFPLFTRPVTGAAGAGAYKISSRRDLPERDTWAERLFHPFIDAKEYSIDVLMGLLPGKAIQCVVRERVEISGGEAKISKIVSNPVLEEQSMRIASSLRLVGHNVMQAFIMEDGTILHIETNPRFGGASNLSIQSGLDSPARLLALHYGAAQEDDLSPQKIAIGATMYRYSEDFIEI